MAEIAQNELKLAPDFMKKLLKIGKELKEEGLPYEKAMKFYLVQANTELDNI